VTVAVVEPWYAQKTTHDASPLLCVMETPVGKSIM
jgi:hypothetical protein